MAQYAQQSLPGVHAPSGTTMVLSEQEIEALFQAARKQSPRNYLMIRMGIFTGLRNSEMLGLTIEDIRPLGAVTQILLLPKEIAKNKKSRTIPLRTELQVDLGRFLDWKAARGEPLDSWSPLFVSENTHKKLSPRDFQRIVKSLAQKAINRRVNPHMLRHTFATMAMRQAPAPVVKELMGHTSLQTTMRYTHPNSDDLTQCVERM